MAYSEELDARIARAAAAAGTTRKRMFGGTCYLLDGNMMCGVWKDFLIVRLGPAEAGAALGERDTREFDVTGRPLKGWVMVGATGYAGAGLDRWLARARAFAATLPPK